ncbi:[acyl-carrier-protein] S-malonyltransferase [Lysinibacillus fusiformis]|jgi:[acyl-carrier-protein] S-malonyltransferase|uniref:ACP S-malonyltransferase n=1 Tax=Lysinibacillus fusiformis TaxID=28031 RepID=UPI000504DE4A|nr:ACP S-malonyltransferase [Lysinibacillus fusiformis]KGA82764.1 malonyl CoA-ACP transacylase [Lysinibacillus fusiformis]MCE4043712.1 ACP S-malonyltransferase [Lysinibacillus fusiformis]QEA00342.1 [acyl-carrier-protein] S-malonyltransferase [Lysinibacillus fusiformis]UXJ69865.1 ACP S-malonyltransferase [Lysinibacillus fusiformis]
MTKIAFIFPGQGSQVVGMGQEFVENAAESRAFYNRADQALELELSKLMLEGPVEELTLTYHAQPALLTTGVMVAEKLRAAGIQPHYAAGHSLGEYGALVIAGVMSFEDAVKTVHKRGLYMNEAVPAGQGAMAAILGMELEALNEVTEQVSAAGEPVQVANVNCPGQIVISGTKEGVEKASSAAKEAGAKRAIPLVVSGPFHSELMRPSSEKLEAALANVTLAAPQIPVVGNVMAKELMDVPAIQQELVEQVYSAVQWEASMREMIAQGVDVFIECGPGKVLSGLLKKIDRSVTAYCVYDEASLEAVLEASKEWSINA